MCVTSKCRTVRSVTLNLQSVFDTLHAVIFMIYTSTGFHTAVSNDSSVTVNKSTVSEQFCEAAILSYHIP
jgi:hypothetical protein